MTAATAVIVNTSALETINVTVVTFDGTTWNRGAPANILPGAAASVTASSLQQRILVEDGVPVSPG